MQYIAIRLNDEGKRVSHCAYTSEHNIGTEGHRRDMLETISLYDRPVPGQLILTGLASDSGAGKNASAYDIRTNWIQLVRIEAPPEPAVIAVPFG